MEPYFKVLTLIISQIFFIKYCDIIIIKLLNMNAIFKSNSRNWTFLFRFTHFIEYYFKKWYYLKLFTFFYIITYYILLYILIFISCKSVSKILIESESLFLIFFSALRQKCFFLSLSLSAFYHGGTKEVSCVYYGTANQRF